MQNMNIISLAVKLTGADIVSGFITNEPVIENRDDLIKSSLESYVVMLNSLLINMNEKFSDVDSEILFKGFASAVELTHGEVIGLYISLNPVLYDRNGMILERIEFHLGQLIALYAS